MNLLAIFITITHTLEQHWLLERLVAASLEFAVLALLAGLGLALCRLRNPRLEALTWSLVMAKPLASLTLGSVFPMIRLIAPAPAPVAPTPMMEAVAALPMQAVTVTPESATLTGPQLLMLAWAAGAALMALRWVNSGRVLRKALRNASAPADEAQGVLAAVVQRLGIPTAPRLAVSDETLSPAIIGFVRPVIVIPTWLTRPEQAEALAWALAHELTHWRLRDPWAIALRQLTRVLFFFHPAAWWAGRRWEQAAELACDRQIVGSLEEAQTYARNLLGVMVQVREERRLEAVCALYATRSQIGRRVEALLSGLWKRPARLTRLGAAALLLAAVGVLTLNCSLSSPVVKTRSAEEEKYLKQHFPEIKVLSADQIVIDEKSEKVRLSGHAAIEQTDKKGEVTHRFKTDIITLGKDQANRTTIEFEGNAGPAITRIFRVKPSMANIPEGIESIKAKQIDYDEDSGKIMLHGDVRIDLGQGQAPLKADKAVIEAQPAQKGEKARQMIQLFASDGKTTTVKTVHLITDKKGQVRVE